ncbi:BTAD domain-containing putative transcriptional regulator [Microbispora sp. KK1-11]|uniref:BTAD domain-containing putative transcriptional regulator n=1 Tax=Microbispora sp. KK1-11 TaxID=2053005 RepID=UPI00163C1C0F|nr:BTAD domain-containing putative transcriptional regulator [Microbispora sp. KK1-11]
MEFGVLGPFEVRDGEVPVGVGGPRQRAVLARLVLAGGAVVSTDTLIDDLYRGTPPATALASIHVYVSNLRRVIEPQRAPRTPPRLLVAKRPGYLLATSDVDALRFGGLVADAERRPPARALALLDEALGLWRGLPYADFAGELWAVTEVNRLHELRLVAVERRAHAQLDLGRPEAVIQGLEAETGEHPLRERLWWLLALAYYRAGRQADALATLRRARSLIADQLGLDPGPQLRALEQDILRQAPSLTTPSLAVVPSGSAAPASARPAPEKARPPHGRDRQLAEMESTLGAGMSTIAVTGEPGIGKTWLLKAFRDRCAERGHLTLWGSCHDLESALPLRPWIQILRSLERVHPAPDSEALAGLLDEEAPQGSAQRSARGSVRGSAQGARQRRHQAVADWIRAAAGDRPIVIMLDDLQWADPATLGLLRDVTVLVGEPAEHVPLTLVAAFRDTARAGPLDDVLGRFARYNLLRVRLAGLETAAIRAVAVTVGAEVDERTAHLLTRRTGGNPFFVRETARLLAQGRPLDTVPDAVAGLIHQRLAALDPRVAEVLEIAAVIGRDFDPGMVGEVWAAPVYDLLDQAVRTGLVVAAGRRTGFAHDLVRETLLREIPPLRRAVIHRQVMNAFVDRPGADVAVIAHHAIQAGPAAYAEAAHWAAAMAEQSGLRLAYEEAATWWGRAVEAHGAAAGDPADHVDLLLRQARALLDAGDAPAARSVRARAIRVADRVAGHDGPVLAARALTALDAPSIWNLRNPYEEVELQLVRRFERALDAMPEVAAPERVRLLGGLAQELYDGSDDSRCHVYSAQAVETARGLGDPHLLMRALNARYLSIPSSIYTEEAREIAAELEDLGQKTRTPEFELLAQMMWTHRRMEVFDVAGADEAAARCDAMLARMPLPWPRFQHTMWRAGRLTLCGRYDDAEALYADLDRQAGRIGMWYAGSVVSLGRIFLAHDRGTMSEAEPLIDAVAGANPCGDQALRALLLCGQGGREEARDLVADGWRPAPRDWSWLTFTCLQGAAQAAVGDVHACAATYSALLPYKGRISVGAAIAFLGPVDRFLATLASAMGDDAAAARHHARLARLAGTAGLSLWRDRAAAAAGALRRAG